MTATRTAVGWNSARQWSLAASLVVALWATGVQDSVAQDSVDRDATSVATESTGSAESTGSETPAGPTVPMLGEGTPIGMGSLFDIVAQGGWLMAPIVAASFMFLLFALERAVALRRSRVIPHAFTKRFLHQLREDELDQEQALRICEESNSPTASVFAHAVRKWGCPAVEVEQAVLDGGERAVNHLRRYLRVINGIATVTPLLGLLGTVVGMIRAFNAISTSGAMGRPELLAAGISQALLTTAAGLTVAIPALICYMYFVGKVDQHIIDIDALGQQVVQRISAEAIAAESKKKAPSSKRQAAA
ncbi:MAG: MotA/TolQ/ExbB proton channel family protein [Planctomycetales bacterium]